MADFEPAYARTLANEGGYKLTDNMNDRGGQTYAGISRKMNPQWVGWPLIDKGEAVPPELVQSLYRHGWWEPLLLDQIVNQRVAETIYDFAINTSAWGRPVVAARLAQMVVGAAADGVFGSETVRALNNYNADLFLARYTLLKLARYRDIVSKDKSQLSNLLGWINRLLHEAV